MALAKTRQWSGAPPAMMRLCLLLACAALTACESPTATAGAAGERFAPPPVGKAGLYVASGYIPDVATISVGPSTVGSLGQNAWLRVDLAPGRYEIAARSPYSTDSLSVTLAPNALVFVQLQYIDSRPWRDVLSEVSQDRGRTLVLAGARAAQAH
jgi:hypothetical protein